MKGLWNELEKRFKYGAVVSAAWLIAGLGYAWVHHGWGAFWNMPPNLIGDFFAGLTAPLAFLWLVLGYMQQGEEIKETRVEIKRQADSVEQNTQHAGRDILIRYADLIISDLQFKSLQLVVSLSRDDWGKPYNNAISRSHDAYFNGDKDAPLRRLAILVKEKPDGLRWSYTNNTTAKILVEKMLEDFLNLLSYARNVDIGSRALMGFYENSLYGDVYAIICFTMKRDTNFAVRIDINDLDEVII